VVESVPIHEDIKTGWGNRDRYIQNYIQTLRNLGAEGIHTVIYNFMPVLEWVRTDMEYPLADGTTCLRFDVRAFRRFRGVRTAATRGGSNLCAGAIAESQGLLQRFG